MEKHIFKFGKSSVAIILPKKWTDKNRLRASDGIFVNENNRGELVISRKENDRIAFTKAIDSRTNPDIIARFVSRYYIRGIGKLTIRSKDKITEKQIEEIQKTINHECPGFEIIGQSGNELQIEDFTSIKDIDIDRIVSRLWSLVGQQFAELKGKNIETLSRLEELSDRFYGLGIRYISIAQPREMIKYYRSVIILEELADYLPIIAPMFMRGNEKILDLLRKMFDSSKDGYGGNQNSILQTEIFKKEVRRLIEVSKFDSIQRETLKNIAIRLTQIAEFGLLEEDSPLVLE
jgi:phosphate uptake regulator